MRFLKKGKLWLLFFLGAFTQLTPELFDSFNNWLLFFGSFHPALIHFPIGFLTARFCFIYRIRLPKLVMNLVMWRYIIIFLQWFVSLFNGISLHLSGTYGENFTAHVLRSFCNIVIVEHSLFIGLH